MSAADSRRSTLSTSQHPAKIGRYQILKPLGSGAMGDVFLAHDPNIDRQIALKTVRVIGGNDEDIADRKQRLLREARAAGRLHHPNVVALFDADEADGLLYLAFEFVPGQDLLKRARTPPELSLREILNIVRETAAALGAAHQQDIVHRDIKPSNILIGPKGEAKVADFGIAKLYDQSTELTRTGSVVGSPQYMSPEQIRGEELDGRSDIFSLGVVLYELLSRTRPFAGDTISTLVFEILAKEPPPIESLRPSLPPRLVQLVRWMLAKDRNQRIPTARQVVSEIETAEREIAANLLDRPIADTGADNQPTRLMPSGSDVVPKAAPTPPPFAGSGLAQTVAPPPSGTYAAAPGTPPAFPSAAQPIAPPPYPTSSAPGAYQNPPIASQGATYSPAPPPGQAPPGMPYGGQPNYGPPSGPPSGQPGGYPPGVQGPFSPGQPNQHGPSPYGQPPARPTKSHAGKILAALVLFSFLGVVGIGLMYLLASDDTATDTTTETTTDETIDDTATDEATDDTATDEATDETTDDTATDETTDGTAPDDGGDAPAEDSGYGNNRPTTDARNQGGYQSPANDPYGQRTETRPPQNPERTDPAPSDSDQRGPLARLGEAARPADSSPTLPPIRPTTPDEPEVDDAWTAAAAGAKQEIESGLRFQFKVTPPEARVLFWAQGDRRAIVQGSAGEFDPKRDEEARILELPGDGEYLLLLRHGDFPDYVIRVHADRSRGDKPRLLQMSLGGSGRTTSVIKVSKGVSFAGTPDDAYVIVDGKNKGRASDYPGGKKARSEENLKLDRGIHIIRLEAEGFKSWEIRVEVSGGAPAIEQINYKLEKDS